MSQRYEAYAEHDVPRRDDGTGWDWLGGKVEEERGIYEGHHGGHHGDIMGTSLGCGANVMWI